MKRSRGARAHACSTFSRVTVPGIPVLAGAADDPIPIRRARPPTGPCPQWTTSVFTNACNSSSEPLPIGSTPRLTSCCLTSAQKKTSRARCDEHKVRGGEIRWQR
jgi:hypothetical protein